MRVECQLLRELGNCVGAAEDKLVYQPSVDEGNRRREGDIHHLLWRRASARNVSYCLPHGVYYPHQHSVDTPVCLPHGVYYPHQHSVDTPVYDYERSRVTNAMSAYLCFPVQSMAIIRPKLDEVFYFEGSKQSSPNCGITIAPYYIPSGSYHLYTTAMTHECSEHTASQLLPFFVPRFGPKYTEWTVTGHEQLPGHHLEVSNYNIPAHTADSFKGEVTER